MKTLIYPDIETDLAIYENLNSEIIVYDKIGIINTDYEKTDDVDVFSQVDAIILTHNAIKFGKYDTKSLEEACINIRDKIRDDTLIIIDSTVPPRTVYKMSKVIDEYGLIPDINLAYTTYVKEDTRVMAATNENSLKTTIALYENTIDNIQTVDHIQTAEIVPILQNAYKDTQIALSNQNSILAEALTIDLAQAIDVANMDEDVNLLYPQAVLKNEIARDSSELVNLANEYGETAQLSEVSRSTNNYIAYHLAYMAEKELFLKHHLAMFEIKVAILGITDDDELITEKDNPSLILIDDFVSRDVEVWVHDDKVSDEIIEDHGAKKITLDEAYEADCIIVMCDTEEYRSLDPTRIEKVLLTAKPIYDREKFKDVELSSVGQYRLKKGEML